MSWGIRGEAGGVDVVCCIDVSQYVACDWDVLCEAVRWDVGALLTHAVELVEVVRIHRRGDNRSLRVEAKIHANDNMREGELLDLVVKVQCALRCGAWVWTGRCLNETLAGGSNITLRSATTFVYTPPASPVAGEEGRADPDIHDEHPEGVDTNHPTSTSAPRSPPASKRPTRNGARGEAFGVKSAPPKDLLLAPDNLPGSPPMTLRGSGAGLGAQAHAAAVAVASARRGTPAAPPSEAHAHKLPPSPRQGGLPRGFPSAKTPPSPARRQEAQERTSQRAPPGTGRAWSKSQSTSPARDGGGYPSSKQLTPCLSGPPRAGGAGGGASSSWVKSPAGGGGKSVAPPPSRGWVKSPTAAASVPLPQSPSRRQLVYGGHNAPYGDDDFLVKQQQQRRSQRAPPSRPPSSPSRKAPPSPIATGERKAPPSPGRRSRPGSAGRARSRTRSPSRSPARASPKRPGPRPSKVSEVRGTHTAAAPTALPRYREGGNRSSRAQQTKISSTGSGQREVRVQSPQREQQDQRPPETVTSPRPSGSAKSVTRSPSSQATARQRRRERALAELRLEAEEEEAQARARERRRGPSPLDVHLQSARQQQHRSPMRNKTTAVVGSWRSPPGGRVVPTASPPRVGVTGAKSPPASPYAVPATAAPAAVGAKAPPSPSSRGGAGGRPPSPAKAPPSPAATPRRVGGTKMPPSPTSRGRAAPVPSVSLSRSAIRGPARRVAPPSVVSPRSASMKVPPSPAAGPGASAVGYKAPPSPMANAQKAPPSPMSTGLVYSPATRPGSGMLSYTASARAPPSPVGPLPRAAPDVWPRSKSPVGPPQTVRGAQVKMRAPVKLAMPPSRVAAGTGYAAHSAPTSRVVLREPTRDADDDRGPDEEDDARDGARGGGSREEGHADHTPEDSADTLPVGSPADTGDAGEAHPSHDEPPPARDAEAPHPHGRGPAAATEGPREGAEPPPLPRPAAPAVDKYGTPIAVEIEREREARAQQQEQSAPPATARVEARARPQDAGEREGAGPPTPAGSAAPSGGLNEYLARKYSGSRGSVHMQPGGDPYRDSDRTNHQPTVLALPHSRMHGRLPAAATRTHTPPGTPPLGPVGVGESTTGGSEAPAVVRVDMHGVRHGYAAGGVGYDVPGGRRSATGTPTAVPAPPPFNGAGVGGYTPQQPQPQLQPHAGVPHTPAQRPVFNDGAGTPKGGAPRPLVSPPRHRRDDVFNTYHAGVGVGASGAAPRIAYGGALG